MDYKYIDQLLERYWDGLTTLEEEHILRIFFSQKEIPGHLMKYKSLFEYEKDQKELGLGHDFDDRILQQVQACPQDKMNTTVLAQRLTLSYRLRPLYRAAAIVAVFLLVGGAVQYTFNQQKNPQGWDYNAANYQDTYRIPQEAFEAGMGGLEEIQDLLQTSPNTLDTLPTLSIKK